MSAREQAPRAVLLVTHGGRPEAVAHARRVAQALTAAGIVGPIVSQMPISPVVIGFAIASGALFAVQVNSNFFWMFKGLLGLSTKGALKTLTTVTCLASVVVPAKCAEPHRGWLSGRLSVARTPG